jgi:hypothetical protein
VQFGFAWLVLGLGLAFFVCLASFSVVLLLLVVLGSLLSTSTTKFQLFYLKSLSYFVVLVLGSCSCGWFLILEIEALSLMLFQFSVSVVSYVLSWSHSLSHHALA